MKKVLIAIVAVLSAVILTSGNALAADLTCTAPSAGGTFNNVVVLPGASCALDNTTVLGNITVDTGASLTVTANAGDTTVTGNIQGIRCNEIELQDNPDGGATHRTVVGGNLTINSCTQNSGVEGSISSGPLSSLAVLIGGHVMCMNNLGGCGF